MRFLKTGLTLIELMISIVLLIVIILAATTFDTIIRKSFRNSDIQTQLLTELSPAMQQMTKFIMQAVGTVNDNNLNRPIAIANNPTRIRTRLDIDSTTRVPNNTPSDYSDDTWISYNFQPGQNTITYCPVQGNGWAACPQNEEVIARRISNFSVQDITSPLNLVISISITACNDPDGDPDLCGSLRNPQVNLTSSISPRAISTN